MIIAGREDRQALADIIQILRNTQNPQVANKHHTPADRDVVVLAFVMVLWCDNYKIIQFTTILTQKIYMFDNF